MKIQVHAHHGMSAEERTKIERIARLGLTRLGSQIAKIFISFSDQNGPKGGVDMRCVFRVHLHGLPDVVIEEVGPSSLHALGMAVERANRAIVRTLERRRRHRELASRDTSPLLAN